MNKGIQSVAVSNWGNYPVIQAHVIAPRTIGELRRAVAAEPHMIARGLGRCYGDASLAKTIISTQHLNRFIAFDPEQGIISCQAGTSLQEILELIVPAGWFLPVTPGTKFITVGGAIASDVHGKNHHKDGSFCAHVTELSLLTADGHFRRCSPTTSGDLFRATCGGMGLTGVIVEATFTLKRIETAYIQQSLQRAGNLDAIFRAFEATRHATYSVAWIDCLASGRDLGRSVLFLGEHAPRDSLSRRQARRPLSTHPEAKLLVPFPMPGFMLNRWSVKAFNAMIYATKRDSTGIVHYDPFFYPLDSIHHWNRIYGRRGFVQYQCVLPKAESYDGMREILTAIGEFGHGSFLAVLKLFGHQDDLVSFPMEGYTLALDFPVFDALFPFLDRLDQLVLARNGRLYLSKDARMSSATFHQSYGQLDRFREIKRGVDANARFTSLQSERLEI